MNHRDPAATRPHAAPARMLLLLLAAAVVPALGCAGSRANTSNSQGPSTGPNAGAGGTSDSGSRMLGLGTPVGGITVETPPVQGGSADAPLPPPLPAGATQPGRDPAPPPAPTWPPANRGQAPGEPPPGEPPPGTPRPRESSGLGAPPVPPPEIRRTR